MSAGGDDAEDSDDDGDGERADEEIRREHEGQAGFAKPAKIENGDDDENADAESDRVWLETRDGADERADSGRDADGRGKNVVGEERGGGEEAGKRAEIVARDGVGAATLRIGLDRLTVREVNNDEQDDDRGAERQNVVEAEQPERNEQAECGFGAVRRGAESVEAEDGDAATRADLLGALFAGGDGLTDDDVENVHRASWSMVRCRCVLSSLPDALLRRDDEPLMHGGAAERMFVTRREESQFGG